MSWGYNFFITDRYFRNNIVIFTFKWYTSSGIYCLHNCELAKRGNIDVFNSNTLL